MNIGIILTEKNSFPSLKSVKTSSILHEMLLIRELAPRLIVQSHSDHYIIWNDYYIIWMCDFNCMFFLSMLILTANYFGLFIYQPFLTLFELKKGVMMTLKRRLFFSALFQIVFQLNITSRFQGRCIGKRAVV